MSTADKIALANTIITGIGVLITAVLTTVIIYLTQQTAKANKESPLAAKESAAAAQESFELAKRAAEYQSEKETRLWETLRRRYKRKVFKAAKECHEALLSGYSLRIRPDDGNNNISGMTSAPRSHGLSDDQLALYFTDDEAEEITLAWETFNYFIKHYYKNPYNGEEEARAVSAADGWRTNREVP